MQNAFYVPGCPRPSQDEPSQAKAQDENPREGYSKSAFFAYLTNILKMSTQAQNGPRIRVFTCRGRSHNPQEADSCVNLRASSKSELLHEVASAMGPLARVFTCRSGPGPPRPWAQAEAKPGQTKPERRIWLAGEAFQDTESYVFLHVGEAEAQAQTQAQAQPKPGQTRPGRRI